MCVCVLKTLKFIPKISFRNETYSSKTYSYKAFKGIY